ALRDRCPGLRQLVWMEDGDSPDGSPARGRLAAHDASAAPAALGARVGARPAPAGSRATSLAATPYTGGTTGLPKGVMQTHGNLVVNAKHMLWANPLFESARFLHRTPMFHSAGVANMSAQTLVAGTQITCPGFDPDVVGRMIERYRVSVCVLVPAMINMFLNHPPTAERDLSSWRLCLYAASPIPIALLQRAMSELPCGFSQGYGMTEMSPDCCQLTSDDNDKALAGDADAVRRLASAGTPCIGVDVETRRPDG